MTYLSEKLLSTLTPLLDEQPLKVLTEFSYYMTGYQGLFVDQLPINPYVIEGLGLSYVSPDFNTDAATVCVRSKSTSSTTFDGHLGWRVE